MATLSEKLQQTLLHMYQHRVRILYKPDPEFYIADWLSSHNSSDGKDEEITGMKLNINAIETCSGILECMKV